MKKKIEDYNNLIAKMLEEHNQICVPLLKKFSYLSLRSVKISKRRILLERDRVEFAESLANTFMHQPYFEEWLITNSFIINLLPESSLETILPLLVNRRAPNELLLGQWMLYSLVQEAKKEILKTYSNAKNSNS